MSLFHWPSLVAVPSRLLPYGTADVPSPLTLTGVFFVSLNTHMAGLCTIMFMSREQLSTDHDVEDGLLTAVTPSLQNSDGLVC